MKISLLISTYNWKEALGLCLESVFAQTRLPDEILIADDGSREDTAQLVRAYAEKSPVPLLHVWHPDEGFQLAKIRNRGIAAASGDYLVQLDGDMIVNRFFIEDHARIAKPHAFAQGKRAFLSPEATKRALDLRTIRFGPFSPGIKWSHRRFLLRSRWLSAIFSSIDRRTRGILGCNMAYWRDDALRVNGFDERFVGYGGEDGDFALRLLHLGLERLYMKHLAFGVHLYHPCRANPEGSSNEQFVQECRDTKASRCIEGVERYLQNGEENVALSPSFRNQRAIAS
jgi:glycosyltransferase involved in cell wall biosynthesis